MSNTTTAGPNALCLDRFMDYTQSEQMFKDNRINIHYGHKSNTNTDLAEDGRAKTLGLRDICGRVILGLLKRSYTSSCKCIERKERGDFGCLLRLWGTRLCLVNFVSQSGFRKLAANQSQVEGN